MAVRAEMGRVSLSRQAGWRERHAAIESGRGSDAVFSGTGRGGAAAKRCAVHARWRNRRSAGKKFFVRRSVAADTPCREPGRKTLERDAGAGAGVRSAGHRERQRARRAAAGKAPRCAGGICKDSVQGKSDLPFVARDDELCRCEKMAGPGGLRLRRRDRQATRSALSGRQPRGHAKDQEIPQRRLRDRWISLREKQTWRQTGGRLAAIRAL